MRVSRRAEFVHRQLRSANTGEGYSLSAVLSGALGAKDFFLRHEILPPGRRASAPHRHRLSEEIVIVVRGKIIAREGTRSAELETGDCICFAAGETELHYLANESAEPAELFCLSRKLAEPDVEFAGSSSI